MGGGGIQYTANQGQEWTSIRTTTQEGDFQVSKRVKLKYRQRGDVKGIEMGDSNKKNHKGCYGHKPSICISVLIKAVFRL